MSFPSVFDPATTQKCLERLAKLEVDTQPQWGKMDAAQMLAHLNVAYDITYGHKPVKYNGFARFMLKLFVKDMVVGTKPYKKNSRTAPAFLIADSRDFEKEKAKLIAYIKDTEQKGKSFFEGKKSSAFGVLSSEQWSTQFYKHMDWHFTQFGI